jgi:large subunit ribosomal protein L25
MAEIILNVDVRDGVGTGGARAARRAGFVPGVLYGGEQAPVAISVNEKDFRKSLYTGKLLGHLVTLKYGDETQPVIAKDVQFDPVSDRPLHFDLMRVDANAKIKIEVPIHFINEDQSAIKTGGVLNIVRHEVELHVPASNIPEAITFDLAGLKVGDSIHISAVKLPAGVTPVITDRDFTVATIVAPAAGIEEEEAGEETSGE